MKICLDAGHYKNYNQGIVKTYYEGNIVWKITNLQKKYLEEYKNVTVILTRSNISKDLALSSRGAMAKGCDLFISNHTNAVDTESVDRPVVIYPYDNKNNAIVLGKKIGQVTQDLIGSKQNYQMMTRRLTSGGEYYGVMRSARSTGCPLYYILEHGFHTNKATCNWFLKDANLEKLAKAQVEVIAKHFGLVKKSTTTATTPSTPTTSDYKRIVGTIEILADTLNVRKSADFNSTVVTTLKKGQKVSVMAIQNGLYMIKEGQWCSAGEKYVKFTETKTDVYEVTADALNVRKGRGTEFDKVGSLKKGDRIAIWSFDNDSKGQSWGSFRYSFKPDIVGYVSKEYLKGVK